MLLSKQMFHDMASKGKRYRYLFHVSPHAGALNRLTRRADYIVRVHGDSMEPQFSDGDRVLVRRQPVVENGEVGVFLRDGERVIKIYRDGALESVNPKYGRMEFRGFSECKGLVLGVLKDEWVSEKDSE